MYLKQFMRLFSPLPVHSWVKAKHYTTLWFLFSYVDKSPGYRNVCKLLLSKWPYTRYWVFWEILLINILKGKGMNLLWKKMKPQKQSMYTHTHTHTHTHTLTHSLFLSLSLSVSLSLHQRVSRTSWNVALMLGKWRKLKVSSLDALTLCPIKVNSCFVPVQ